MGFPVCYSELPKLLLHLLFLLAHLRSFITWTFHSLGLNSLLEYETQRHNTIIHSHHNHYHQEQKKVGILLAEVIQESLPVIQFGDLLISEGGSCHGLTESCAVCLYEFEAADEVRRMSNCRHVFHRQCIDQWLEHGQCTCPLCRVPLLSKELQYRDWAILSTDGSSYGDEYHYFLSSPSAPMPELLHFPSS